MCISALALATVVGGCQSNGSKHDGGFKYSVEKFADVEILRYRVPGFEDLPLAQKQLLYYLSQAALEGRDIIFAQFGKYNLPIRSTLEAIYTNYAGDKTSADFEALAVYLKRVWFSNGIHHHYATDKFTPAFSQEFFIGAVKSLEPSALPLQEGQSVDDLLTAIMPVIFDPAVLPKRVNQADGVDLISTSANDFYEGVTQKEVEDFYAKIKDPKSKTPPLYGLNSRLAKRNGKLVEEQWRVGGLYSAAIEKIVYWLQKAAGAAESDVQRKVIETLITYYTTGDLRAFDAYSILWASDTSRVDFINGYIEVYGDPLSYKGSWEAMVNFRDEKATQRTQIISNNAQWFEDNSPMDKRFKKEKVKGVSAKVITAVTLAGDCYPATPIGINLPNSRWIREQHGSKSVTIENITGAYDQASQGNGFAEEFYWSEVEISRAHDYGFVTDNLHTDLHECVGHASGRLLPNVTLEALKAYSSSLEEGRADLFGLYYIADPKLVTLGILPNDTAYKAEYYKYMTNGLMTQLVRIVPGKNVEEAHMRNRQFIARWALEKGAADKVVELVKREGKTYVRVNDYAKLRTLFGLLLGEVQRIVSEGDYEAGKNLVETYGVKVDADLHKEVLSRYASLNIAPYKGFVNPVYTPITDGDGNITDVTVAYTEDYAAQMLRYSREHSWLK